MYKIHSFSCIGIVTFLVSSAFIIQACKAKIPFKCSNDNGCDKEAYCHKEVCVSANCSNDSECFEGRKCINSKCAFVENECNTDAAGPKICSVVGDIEHKKAVTIGGLQFGLKENAAPLRYDNFESGTPGERLAAEGGKEGWSSNALYSTDKIRHHGTLSLFQNFRDGNYADPVKLTTNSLLPGTTKLYFSGWFNLVTGGEVKKSTSTSIFSIEACGTEPKWRTTLGVHPNNGSGVLFADTTGGGISDWSPNDRALKDDGQWHRLEGWLDLGTTNGNDGYRDVSVDLSRVGKIEGNFLDRPCSLTILNVSPFFATASGSAWAERYWDELYVDTTRARVEIGDREVFENCTHREIQAPTSWSDQSITILLNQGTFASNEPVYVFVVDADGNPSNGYRVNFDGEP